MKAGVGHLKFAALEQIHAPDRAGARGEVRSLLANDGKIRRLRLDRAATRIGA